MQDIIKLLLFLCAMGAFVACDKTDNAKVEQDKSGFDFTALKAEAQAQEIDLSKIVLKDSSNIDSNSDSMQNGDSTNLTNDAKSNSNIVSTPQIIKSMAKFYLLEGEIEGQGATLYLKISSIRMREDEVENGAIAYITGQIVCGNDIYTLKGEVENNAQVLALEIRNGDKMQIFEARIAQNGEVSATFIGDDIFKDGTNAEFKTAQGKINEATIFGVSVAQKHKGKDFDGSSKDFDFNVATQIPLITSPTKINFALDKINSTLREIAMPELREYGEDSTNFSSVSTFNIDYIDEKIIVLGNYNYLYSGGAHGVYSDDAISFDLSSGERLPNDADALLKDKNDPAMIKTLLLKETLAREYEGNVDKNAELTRFRIRPNGVEFYWGVYEVAPYAVGIVTIQFGFSELAPFVREDSPYYYLFKK